MQHIELLSPKESNTMVMTLIDFPLYIACSLGPFTNKYRNTCFGGQDAKIFDIVDPGNYTDLWLQEHT